MPTIKLSKQIMTSPSIFHSIVTRVDQYHTFIPWISKSTVSNSIRRPFSSADETFLSTKFPNFDVIPEVHKSVDSFDGSFTVNLNFTSFVFTSSVFSLSPNIVVSTKRGSSIVNNLESLWEIQQVQLGCTEVKYINNYELTNGLLSAFSEPLMNLMGEKIVDAFEKEAIKRNLIDVEQEGNFDNYIRKRVEMVFDHCTNGEKELVLGFFSKCDKKNVLKKDGIEEIIRKSENDFLFKNKFLLTLKMNKGKEVESYVGELFF